jgi:hypothetical protein
MFSLFKKIIDDKTAYAYCGLLTGARPLTVPVGREVRHDPIASGSVYVDPEIPAGSRMVSVFDYELIYRYAGDDACVNKPLIKLEFSRSQDGREKNVVFAFRPLSSDRWLMLSMDNDCYDVIDKKAKITESEIETAVEVAKWIIAVVAKCGRMSANHTIKRTNFRPKSLFE